MKPDINTQVVIFESYEWQAKSIVTGLVEIFAGLLIAIFSGPLARVSIAWNRRVLGIELPFAWVRIGGVLVGGLLSFAGVLRFLGWPAV